MSRTLLAVTALSVLVVLMATSFDLWTSPDLREEGDLAANALQVERAREGRELLGPYSQHGFHHPGPASFYHQALSEPLFFMLPSLMARHLAAQLTLNLAAFTCAMWLLHRAGLSPPAAVAGLLLAMTPLLFLAGGNMFMLASVWGPLVVVGPMVLFVAAMARLAEGDLVAAPFAAAGATLAWHTHVLTMTPLGVVWLLTGASLLGGRHRLGPGLRSRAGMLSCATALLITAAGLVPVALEQATHEPGNLTLMWRFLRGQETQVHPWPEVIRTLGQAFTDPLVVLIPSQAEILGSAAATLTLVMAMFIMSAVQFRRSGRAWRTVLFFAWATIATAVVTARHLYGELDTYLFYYVYGMVGLLYVAAAHGIHSRWPSSGTGSGTRAGYRVAAACLVLLTPWLLTHPVEPPAPRDDFATVMAALGLAAAPALHLSLGAGERDEDLWSRVPTFALRLRRAGTRVTVDERFVVVCGEEMRRRPDDPQAPTLLFSRNAPDPGQADHVRIGDWGVFVLRPVSGSGLTDASRPALPATDTGSAGPSVAAY